MGITASKIANKCKIHNIEKKTHQKMWKTMNLNFSWTTSLHAAGNKENFFNHFQCLHWKYDKEKNLERNKKIAREK